MARNDRGEFGVKGPRGAESISNFYDRMSSDGRSASVRSRKQSANTNYADLPRSSYSTEENSNRFATDDEGLEETWSDAQDRAPKVYNSFSAAAAAASRPSLSQRPSLANLPPGSPQHLSQSGSNSPVLSSPMTPSSSSGAHVGHRPKQDSVRRIAGLGAAGGSPSSLSGAEGFTGFSTLSSNNLTKQASWSSQTGTPLQAGRKASDPSIRLADPGMRRDSSSGGARPAAISTTVRQRPLPDEPRQPPPRTASHGQGDSKLVGLGLGAASSSASVSEFEQGRGYGWTPDRERSLTGSGPSKTPLRSDASDSISKKGSFGPLGRAANATSEVDLSRPSRLVSATAHRVHSDMHRPSQDFVAVSLEQETLESEAAAAASTSRPSAFAKLFRRKGKQSSEAASPGATATPTAARQVRRTASQHALAQNRDASIDEAPLVVVSPKAVPPLPAAASTLGSRRPVKLDTELSRPSKAEPSADELALATPKPTTRGMLPPPSGPLPPAPKSAAALQDRHLPGSARVAAAKESLLSDSADELRVDTTPIPGRDQTSPSTPLMRSSVQRHMKQSSFDSSSSSARRRSLAFLASAITMGVNEEGSSPRNVSSSSLDLGRPSTATGIVSSPSDDKASKPPTAAPNALPASIPSSSPNNMPTATNELSHVAGPVPIRNLNRPKLVAKGAIRDDRIPSVLSDFLKLDAMGPGAKGRVRGQKTAAALYADAYRSSSDEDGPDNVKPTTLRPERSKDAASTATGAGRSGDSVSANGDKTAESEFRTPQSVAAARRGSADDRSGMSNLHRATSGKSTAGSSDAKRSAYSVSPKNSRAGAVRGQFMASPAGPSMGGYVSPFYVAPLTAVDGRIGAKSSRPIGRRASGSSRSIASDESRSVKSGVSGSTGAVKGKASTAPKALQEEAKVSTTDTVTPSIPLDTERLVRKARSHTNLKTSAAAQDEDDKLSALAQQRRPSLGIVGTAKANTPATPPPSSLASSQSRLRSASSSSFGQRLFRRPRTAGGDLSAHPLPSIQTTQQPEAEPSPRAASYDLLASPTDGDSIEFEMLDTSGKNLDIPVTRRGSSTRDAGRLSHDIIRPRDEGATIAGAKRDSRGRSNSISSIDVHASGARSGMAFGRASTDAYAPDRRPSDSDRRNFSPSRLDSSGGVANLFGGGGRQRTSSLLPSFGFGRSRTSSNAGLGASTPNGTGSGTRSPEPGADATGAVSGLPAHEGGHKSFAAALAGIASADPGQQGGLRRKTSFRAFTGSRKGSASGPNGAKGRSDGTSLHPEEYVPRLSRDSGEDGRSAGRLSSSSTRRSSSSRASFQRRPSSRAQGSAADLDAPQAQAPQPTRKLSSKETAPWPDETPEEYAERIAETVPKTEIAAVLASSADEFHAAALRHHMTIFWFNGNALDIALRKLLMDLHLPKETQQIDRVMESFAKRYNECNDGLFASDDQPYILSFSLMMLHTDAFNKNAKHKMTKADYLRNTGPSGVPTEILEYLYDNLTFTQFIYIEDKDDLQRRASEAAMALNSMGPLGAGSGNAAGLGGPALYAPGVASGQAARTRIDPYYLIAQGKLGELRADIDHLIPEDTPFSYTGTLAGFDVDRLNAAFLHAPSIEIATGRPSTATPTGSSWVGLEGAPLSPPPQLPQQDEVVSLKVTKVGVISRKDDVGDGGRKTASRKWKTCGLLLTGSQLLLFKDIVWTTALQSQILDQVGHSQVSNGISPPGPDEAEPVEGGIVISPRITYFRPDGVISLADAVAVKDNTYTKYDNVFRLLAAKGRQYLVQAQNEDDMNDWIHKINFCACFRTCDLKIRGLDLSTRFAGALASGAASSSGRRDSRSQARRPSAASEARSFASEGRKLGNSSNFSSMSDMDSVANADMPRSNSIAGLSSAAVRSTSPDPLNDAEGDDDEDQEELYEGDEAYRAMSPTSRPRSRASSRASTGQPLAVLKKRLAARRELMLAKIEETGVSLKKVSDILNEEMRLARHFAVLTPFQKVTRDRIEAAALPLSRKIKELRLELAKEESRVRILKLDLAAGERVARGTQPSLKLSTSFVNEAKKMPGSQLATPQLLELSGMSDGQAAFEDMFGGAAVQPGSGKVSASRSFETDTTSPIEAAGRARLAQSQRRASSEAKSSRAAVSSTIAGGAVSVNSASAASSAPLPNSLGALSSGRITKPAHQQRHQTNLNSVSEQPADESPVLGSRPHLGADADDSFQSSRPSDTDLASADTTGADEDEDEDEAAALSTRDGALLGADGTASHRDSTKMGKQREIEGSASPSRSSVSRSSASFEGRRALGSNDSLPVEEADEVPEEWDMSRLARDGHNRISLVDLPSPGELKEATTRRFIFGVSESSTIGEREREN